MEDAKVPYLHLSTTLPVQGPEEVPRQPAVEVIPPEDP